MLTSDQREVELDEEQLLYVSEFWMEPLRRTAASLVMCGCVALDTEPIGNAHTASAFLVLARADGVEALARKNLVKFRRSLTRSSHVQLIHTSSLACLSSSPKSDFARGHVGHVGTGGFCGQVSTNPTHVTRLQDFTLNKCDFGDGGQRQPHRAQGAASGNASGTTGAARRGAAAGRLDRWGDRVCARRVAPWRHSTCDRYGGGDAEGADGGAGGLRGWRGGGGGRGTWRTDPHHLHPPTCPRASFGAVNDANPTRRGTVLPYPTVFASWIDFRAKSDEIFRRRAPRGGFGPESPLLLAASFH